MHGSLIIALGFLCLTTAGTAVAQDVTNASADAVIRQGIQMVTRDFDRREVSIVIEGHFAPRPPAPPSPSTPEGSSQTPTSPPTRPAVDPATSAAIIALLTRPSPSYQPAPTTYQPPSVASPLPQPPPTLASSISSVDVTDRLQLEGAVVYAIDHVTKDQIYLGRITDRYHPESIFNEFGRHGSKYGTASIWNEYGRFGTRDSRGALNEYATNPPYIFKDSRPIGRLTINQYIPGSVSPYYLRVLFP